MDAFSAAAENSQPRESDRRPSNRKARSHDWCVCMYNHVDKEFWERKLAHRPKNVRYCVAKGETCPKTGRAHVHVYIRFDTAQRMSAVKRFVEDNTAHCKVRMGTEAEAVDYVKKPESTLWEFVEVGTPMAEGEGQGKRFDIAELQAAAKAQKTDQEILELYPGHAFRYLRNIREVRAVYDHPEAVENMYVYVLWGPTGIGKSHWVYQLASNTGVPFWEACYRWNWREKWFDGYRRQDILWLDEFEGTDRCPITRLLALTDKYPKQEEIKGRENGCYPRYEIVFITSNLPSKDWFPFASTDWQRQSLARRITAEVTGANQQEFEANLRAVLPMMFAMYDANHQPRPAPSASSSSATIDLTNSGSETETDP